MLVSVSKRLMLPVALLMMMGLATAPAHAQTGTLHVYDDGFDRSWLPIPQEVCAEIENVSLPSFSGPIHAGENTSAQDAFFFDDPDCAGSFFVVSGGSSVLFPGGIDASHYWAPS